MRVFDHVGKNGMVGVYEVRIVVDAEDRLFETFDVFREMLEISY